MACIINENIKSIIMVKKKKNPVGRPPGSKKTTEEIQLQLSYSQLDPVDRAMLTIVAVKPAIANTVLAKQMGMDPRTVKARRDRGLFQLALEKLQRPALMKCKDAQSEAADALIDLLKSKDESIRLKAAQTLLKPLIPSTAIIKHDNTIDVRINNMTTEQLEVFIKDGFKALEINEDNIIDAETEKPSGD